MSAYNKLRADYAKCDTLRFTNGSGSTIAAGAVRLEGTVLGMVLDDTPDGEDGIMIVRAPAPGLLLPKDGSTFAVGARVYWDTVGGQATSTATGNEIIGYAYAAAAAGDAEVQVVLTNEQPVS